MKREESAINIDRGVLQGTTVFPGDTRAGADPDRLSRGRTSLDEFLSDFPSVSRELAVIVLEQAKEALLLRAHSAG
jgi:hypothetical protein